jgi:hypothetical protein
MLVGDRHDTEPEVGPIERAEIDCMPARREPERLHDVGAHLRGGAAGEGDGLGVAELVARGAEQSVAGAKIVSPLADAVRLVHCQQRRADPQVPEAGRKSLQPLG